MKLLYQGPASLDPRHLRRQERRRWAKDTCWELLGVIAFLACFWIFIILMFCM